MRGPLNAEIVESLSRLLARRADADASARSPTRITPCMRQENADFSHRPRLRHVSPGTADALALPHLRDHLPATG